MTPAAAAGDDYPVHIAAEIVALVVTVLVVSAVARRLDWSAPLCLIVVGVGASYVPGRARVPPRPRGRAAGLLPPLLYSAAIQTSLVDFRKNRGAIGLMSVGLVVFTAFGVGLVAWAVIPGLPLAGGIALGAIVAPPDAVAASVVARRVGMPRKLIRLLEGESLFNDAAALVALRTAIAALAGSVSLWQVGADFFRAAIGGAVVGLVVGFVAAFVRARMNEPVLDTALSFAVPFIAYIPAEAIHGSGRARGGHRRAHPRAQGAADPVRLDAAGRRLNWQTIAFLLENMVFLLIGLQLRRILAEVGESGLSLLHADLDLRRRARRDHPHPGAVPDRHRHGETRRTAPAARQARRRSGRGATRRSSRGRACAGWSRSPRRSCCPRTPRSGPCWCSRRSSSWPAPWPCRA